MPPGRNSDEPSVFVGSHIESDSSTLPPRPFACRLQCGIGEAEPMGVLHKPQFAGAFTGRQFGPAAPDRVPHQTNLAR